MQFKQFTLDKFQEDAVHLIEKNNSVVVSAATGTGKTLIADYVIDKYLKLNKKIIYTAPIKALSNQKFRDFKQEYGEGAVGIMTGDVVINAEAELLIMTTEIYRNMLLVKDPLIEHVSYVIFDEIHFLGDIERGTVWEESIIFSPEHIRFLCLSATIPNANEFAEWIQSIKDHTVSVVQYGKRAVPLEHFIFEHKLGLAKAKELKELSEYPEYSKAYRRRRRGKQKEKMTIATHLDIVNELYQKDWIPAIYFSFSRKACEEKSGELAQKKDFASPAEKTKIIKVFNDHLDPNIKTMTSTAFVRRVVQKGVGVHHAGMLPNLKEIVEVLFGMGLLKVLYATETFAVGINMPAKTVCFNSVEKFDGITYRYLNTKEYFQLAGRAGRRGIDKKGNAIILIDMNRLHMDKLMKVTGENMDPLKSQFKLSINTVINLISTHKNEDIDKILISNFDYFQRKKKDKGIKIRASFNNKIKKLKAMGYIEGEELTDKGRFLRYIYANELLVGEVFSQKKIWGKMTNNDLLVTVAAITYEPKRGVFFKKLKVDKQLRHMTPLLFKSKYLEKNLNHTSLKNMTGLISHWAGGCEFEELMELSNLQEGDIIRLFRQIIDCLRQIKRATEDYDLIEKINECKHLIDRDVVQVSL